MDYNDNMNSRARNTKIFVLLLILGPVLLAHNDTKAASFSSSSVTLSNTAPITSSSHTINFTLATEHEPIKEIHIQYGKTQVDLTKPTSLSLDQASLNSVSGLNGSLWTLDTTSKYDGLLKLVSDNGETKAVSTEISVVLDNVTNAEIGECSLTGQMYDTCYVRVITYTEIEDENQQLILTAVDSGTISYQIQDVPSLTFTVEGVDASTLTNGITTTVATNYNTLPFGKLKLGEPAYAAHKLTVATTAANGYKVQVYLDGYLEGTRPLNKIDPFAALNVSWSTPQVWSSPDSSEINSDSGWIGANTSDTRVQGWLNGAGKFGPISSTKHSVMESATKDYGTTAYVTYAIEVNEYQPVDFYTGVMVYEITPTY
ncbi:MAG: hypothetical protein BWY68_00269 [bacterium ADurb.Bin400]|nr:MAG: hypothetical protein BWY68_00269 [bacterium ADurb.Bin400]